MFGPTLEKTSETAILSDTPMNLLSKLIKSGEDKLPLIMGVNRDEGLGEIQSKRFKVFKLFFYLKLS